jgi:hypothetical protein
MTVIEVKPRKWGWCVFESPGVEPVFLEKGQAIGYAETRARLLGKAPAVIGLFQGKRAESAHPVRNNASKSKTRIETLPSDDLGDFDGDVFSKNFQSCMTFVWFLMFTLFSTAVSRQNVCVWPLFIAKIYPELWR